MTHRQRKPMRRTREMDYRFVPKNSDRIKQDAILWMTFDDSDQGSTALVSDHSDYGNHGTNNGATKGLGRNGICKSFVTDDYVDLGSGGGVANHWTISVWFNTREISTNGMLFHYRPEVGDGNILTILKLNDELQLNMTHKDGTSGSKRKAYQTNSINIQTGRWYNFVTTWDATDLLLYLDGVELTDISKLVDGTLVMTDTVRNRRIGSNTVNTDFFDGTINEVIVWNHVISPQEISDLYEGDL